MADEQVEAYMLGYLDALKAVAKAIAAFSAMGGDARQQLRETAEQRLAEVDKP